MNRYIVKKIMNSKEYKETNIGNVLKTNYKCKICKKNLYIHKHNDGFTYNCNKKILKMKCNIYNCKNYNLCKPLKNNGHNNCGCIFKL